MWTRIAALGRWASALRSKSSKDMQRSARLQSTNSTSAPAPIAASGVAMKVLEGQSTVSPLTPANSSAARAPPAQLESPRLGSRFHSSQRCSKASSLAPSDHCSESRTSVHSSNNRERSRWSNPIANLLASGSVFSAAPTVAPCVAGDRLPRRDSTAASSEARRIYQRNRIFYPILRESIVGVCGLEHGGDRPGAGKKRRSGDGDGDESNQRDTAQRRSRP